MEWKILNMQMDLKPYVIQNCHGQAHCIYQYYPKEVESLGKIA